jgi:hypothetical protein
VYATRGRTTFESEPQVKEDIEVFQLYARLPELWGLRSFLNLGAYARRLPGPLGVQRAGPLQLSSRTLLSR